MEVEERDPEQLNCTTSSSCRRSCVQIFIVAQLIVIFILSLCLKSLNTSTNYDYYDIDHDTDDSSNLANSSSYKNSSKYLWVTWPDKMERLNENPVYEQFKITRKKFRPDINLLLIVSSAPRRDGRRSGIRGTWWKHCTSERVKVKCIFMTDASDNLTSIGRNLTEEKNKYNDMEFQDLKGGVEFGKRFMYHMVWAMQNYNFDYFIRMDDDYFFCLKRFLNELILPPPKLYHWGYVHCVHEIVRPEESIIMLSRDLVEAFLGQDPNKLLCHPWADQMIALWVESLKLKQIYNHDKRLHHDPPISHIKNFANDTKDVCRRYIGLHGSYPEATRTLWDNQNTEAVLGVELDEFTVKCDKKQVFKWYNFIDEWKYKPKLCIQNPRWDTYMQEKGHGAYIGRQGA